MHPDQHAIAFVPGNPDIAFVGSDGGMIRTDGKFGNASARSATRATSTGTDLANCQRGSRSVPNRLITMNAGLRTLQFESVSVDPNNPLNDLLGGTQDNATEAFTGSPNWDTIVTGDGGHSGIDVANSKLRYHTYFGAAGRRELPRQQPGHVGLVHGPADLLGRGRVVLRALPGGSPRRRARRSSG